MLKPNSLKKLLINDEKLYILELKEWEIEAINYALEIYKKVLQQQNKRDDMELVEKLLRKIDISYSQGI